MGFGKDGKGVIIRDHDTLTLGALATLAAIKQANPLAITEDFRMLKVEGFISLRGATQVDTDGPIIVGIANDNLSVGEIAEAMVASGPLGPSDRVRTERAERAVFPMWEIDFLPQPSTGENGARVKPITEGKIRWTFESGIGWTFFAFNMGSSALTTGGILDLLHKFYGVWVT